MGHDALYIVLVLGLFVVPKALQRFRLPGAITSLLLGIIASLAGLFPDDAVVSLLGTFGIVALFLIAGMEVRFGELHRNAGVLVQHLAIQAAVLSLVSWLFSAAFGVDWRVAALVGLALLTPSAGFILDSLGSFGLSEQGRFWVKSKAIAAEMLALLTLFVVMQSSSVGQFVLASLALVLLLLVVPALFRLFAQRIVPFAPRSEFAFLIMLAVVCAYATKHLEVYYLVGAFLVGLAAQRFREILPALSSERMLHAVEAFASVFTPFYFFNAGLMFRAADFGPMALLAGAGFILLFVPLRVGLVAFHRRISLKENLWQGLQVGVPLLPTLVFTLVLAQILRERFDAPGWLVGGLGIYTVVNTLVPGLLLHTPPPEYEAPHLAEPSSPTAGKNP
ncbi:MAG: cation:proton antiporter [Myxococcales bacterium]|nr:cation:proton antiporter [Myxococcales bacterium]